MKKGLAVICSIAMLISAGCAGKSDSSSKKEKNTSTSSASDSSGKTNSSSSKASKSDSSSAASSSKKEDNSSKAKPKEPEKDEIDKIVEKGNKEDFSPNGSYSFSYEGFSKVYSNEEMNKCFENISDLINNANCNISISYKNMDSGAQIYCNTDKEYQVCSPIKGPYIKSLLTNGVDLKEKIVRDERWMDDDRTVASADNGTEFTVAELMKYALNESDNTAYYLLYKRFGYQWFNNLMNELGTNIWLGADWLYTQCNVMQIAKCYWDIYDYSVSDKKGEWMTDQLTNAYYNEQIGKALDHKYKVAQKYGSEFEFRSFHDCAIVYADSPFVLCIYTDLYPEIEDSCVIFRELAVEFDNLNRLIVQE